MPFKKGEIPKGAKPFQKGTIPNPNGRPKKIPELDKILAEVLGAENKEGITEAQRIIEALKIKAQRGDVRAAEVLLDRGYGKPKQDIKVETPTTHTLIIKEEIVGNGGQV